LKASNQNWKIVDPWNGFLLAKGAIILMPPVAIGLGLRSITKDNTIRKWSEGITTQITSSIT